VPDEENEAESLDTPACVCEEPQPASLTPVADEPHREEPVELEKTALTPPPESEFPVPGDDETEPESLDTPPCVCEESQPASLTPTEDEPHREEPVEPEKTAPTPPPASEVFVPGDDAKPDSLDTPPCVCDEPQPALQTPVADEPHREEPVEPEKTVLTPPPASEVLVPGDDNEPESLDTPCVCDEAQPAAQTPVADEPRREEPAEPEKTALTPPPESEVRVPGDGEPVLSDEPPQPLAEPQLVAEPLVGEETTTAIPEDLLSHDADAEPEQGMEQASPVPEAPFVEVSPPLDLTPRPVERAAGPDHELTQANGREPDEMDGTRLREIGNPLLQRLWEHHHGPDGPVRRKPLLLAELEIDLGWKRSRVQRAMTNLFGSKPFTKYKARCADGTIQSFLDDLADKDDTGVTDRTLCTSAP